MTTRVDKTAIDACVSQFITIQSKVLLSLFQLSEGAQNQSIDLNMVSSQLEVRENRNPKNGVTAKTLSTFTVGDPYEYAYGLNNYHE